jgi:hypothetical protein
VWAAAAGRPNREAAPQRDPFGQGQHKLGHLTEALRDLRLVALALRATRRTPPARALRLLPRGGSPAWGSKGVSEPLHAAETRLGRRTALTFPLFPPVVHVRAFEDTELVLVDAA